MLCLGRKETETVNIFFSDGTPLGSVCVLGIERGMVRLGFAFPVEYRILRSELVDGEETTRKETA